MVSTPKLHSLSVLIPDDEAWATVKVLRCLDRMPTVKAHVLSRTNSPLARFSRHCSGCHYHTSQNDEDWIGVIGNLCQRLRIDVVLPVTDRGVEFMVRNRQAISDFAAIPALPEPQILNIVQNKWLFHQFARQQGLPAVPSVLVGDAQRTILDCPDLNSIEYPALLKPASQAGGYGIVKIKDPSDFCRVWKDKRIIKFSDQYILQSYIPGVDLCLMVFCKGGKILAYTLQKSLFSPDNYFGPQRAMEFVDDEETVDIGRRLASAMRWDGIGCIDMRMDARDKTERLLEVNPRFGQAILGSLLANVNFPLIACLDAVGLGCPEIHYQTVRYFHPAAHTKILISKLTGKPTPTKVRWKESGLQFTRSDPLPEMVDFMRRTVGRLRR